MAPATILAILLAAIPQLLALSSSLPPHIDIGSPCEISDLICQVKQMKLKVAQLESTLEERSDNLQSRSLLLEELNQKNDNLKSEILKLQSPVRQDSKDAEIAGEDENVLTQLEDEVRSLWSTSRKNNFDLHMLEAKATEAEKRLQHVKTKVEKMADIVTEQWIQIRHLEQAFQGVQMKANDAKRQLCLQNCSLPKRMFLLLDQYLSQNSPSLKMYLSKGIHLLEMVLSAVKKYHLQLQQFVKGELEKHQLTAAYSNKEVVFFVHLDMVINSELSREWPLGFEFINLRLSSTLAGPPVPPPLATSMIFARFPSTSISCVSSCNFETESTASFFQDRSTTLGRFIGFKPGTTTMNTSLLYFPNSIMQYDQHHKQQTAISRHVVQHSNADAGSTRFCGRLADKYEGICTPLLVEFLTR